MTTIVAKMVMAFVAIAALAISVTAITFTSATQPLIVWSKDRQIHDLSVDQVTGDGIGMLFKQPSNNGLLLVFIQNDVTVEDISQFSLSTESPSYMQRAQTSSASSFFAPISGRTSLRDLTLAAPSSIVLQSDDIKIDTVKKHSIVFVQIPSHHVMSLGETDKFVENTIARIEAQLDIQLTVAFLGMSTKPLANEFPRIRRSSHVNKPVTVGGNLRMVNPNYVAGSPEQRHEVALRWFTIPILSGIICGIFFLVAVIVGAYALMNTQTPEQWPDPNHDKNLDVPQ